MKNIAYPLKKGSTGEKVKYLQEILLILLGLNIPPLKLFEKARVAQKLLEEKKAKKYGHITFYLVKLLQIHLGIPVNMTTGEIDKNIAELFNNFIKTIDEEDGVPQKEKNVITGIIINEKEYPFAGAKVILYQILRTGKIKLTTDSSDSDGLYSIQYQLTSISRKVRIQLVVFDTEGTKLCESDIIENPKKIETINLTVTNLKEYTYDVKGVVFSKISAGVEGLKVKIVDRVPGKKDSVLAETETGENGKYHSHFTYSSMGDGKKSSMDVQVKIYSGNKFIGESEVRYNALKQEVLNISLNDDVSVNLVPEYETITTKIKKYYPGKLSEIKEEEEQKDISYLANKTGWDARAVALISLSEQFSEKAKLINKSFDINPEFFYAMFRCGIPAEEEVLHRLSINSVSKMWRNAINEGVISSKLESKIKGASENYLKFAAEKSLAAPAFIGISSLKELLTVSLGDDLDSHESFAELHAQFANDTKKFWEAINVKFGEDIETRLKLDSKLAYLTLNNAPLIEKIHEKLNGHFTQTSDLVSNGYYEAKKWVDIIGDNPVPEEFTGKDENERKQRYAECIAAQLKLSFPTAVISQMVSLKETPLLEDNNIDKVHSFLQDQQNRFEIGMHPIRYFVKKNELEISSETVKEIERIQRVYQITPGDGAMNTLLNNGFDSAHKIIQLKKKEFVEQMKDKLEYTQQAEFIYKRAQQVHNAITNIIVSYIKSKSTPEVGVHSPPRIIRATPLDPPPGTSDILAIPTLEAIFGEMDYCGCEHCRSFLSPAAYLVDLLLFCDDKTETHNPQEVLFTRRPDIQHLQLTCENTNTALPYIDLVNEILEFFVANGSLNGYIGNNTADTDKSEELLASPLYVEDSAYVKLNSEKFPLLLPFNKSLERLRRYFKKYEIDLPTAMKTVRINDNSENADHYGWKDILMEENSISNSEYQILTECEMNGDMIDVDLTLKNFFGFAKDIPIDKVWDILSEAKTFARRINITYEELFSILKTRFINPNSVLIPKLENLGVSFSVLLEFRNGNLSDDEFDSMITQGLDESKYGGNIKDWVRDDSNFNNIMHLITLVDTLGNNNISSLNDVEFRYSDPDETETKIKKFEFIRLIRFIRLWKKLGWTIEQTDKVITVFYPQGYIPNAEDTDAENLEKLNQGFSDLLPCLGVLKQSLNILELNIDKSLLPLLACFATIDVQGNNSLYRQLFLSCNFEDINEDFKENIHGEYLVFDKEDEENKKYLINYTAFLRAAFNLSSLEYNYIFLKLGYDDTTPLNLENLSTIYRIAWLSRKLRISVNELLLLIDYTRLDPFGIPEQVCPTIIKFLEFFRMIKNSSLKLSDVFYLIWNEDFSGKSKPEFGTVVNFSHVIREKLVTIENEFTIIDEPDGEFIQTKMAKVYGVETAELFWGFLNKTVETDTEYGHELNSKEEEFVETAANNLIVKEARLIYTAGVMPDEMRQNIMDAEDISDEFKAAINTIAEKSFEFLNRFPELKLLHDDFIISDENDETKYKRLLTNILDELKTRRKRQQVLQEISTHVETEELFANAVLTNPNALHSVDDPEKAALNDFMEIQNPGLLAKYYYGNQEKEIPDDSETNVQINYDSSGLQNLPDNGGNPLMGVWSGYIVFPENGEYEFQIESDARATIHLAISGTTIELNNEANTWSSEEPFEFKSGSLNKIFLSAKSLTTKIILRWKRIGYGWETIPVKLFYSEHLLKNLYDSYVRFRKAATWSEKLKLSAAEIVYISTYPKNQINNVSWLNKLSVNIPPLEDDLSGLLKIVDTTIKYSLIKDQLSPGKDDLIITIQNPEEEIASEDCILLKKARWEFDSLKDLLIHFGKVDGDNADIEALKDIKTFNRIFEAFVLLRKIGVSAKVFIASTTNNPTPESLINLQSALRARYSNEEWLLILKSINDEIRTLQRNALVTYILHQMSLHVDSIHIDTPEKLFEYFLVDVSMESCMQTSRIRFALSSIQLFISRSLNGLEKNVFLSKKDGEMWEWMSRYRVWEANRKIYLYPENWLDPELRDDQSPFFKETLSELLQGDISNDRAANALYNYLQKLDEVAKLEPCGMYYVEKNDQDQLNEEIHFVGRTSGIKRKYYYRYYDGASWFPWEQINLDIEDNPVIPLMWKNRLFLFWLKIFKNPVLTLPKKPDPGQDLQDIEAGDLIGNIGQKINIKAVICWSEYINNQWQAVKTSDINNPGLLDTDNINNNNTFIYDRSKIILKSLEDNNDFNSLKIIAGTNQKSSLEFNLYNTHSLPYVNRTTSYAMHTDESGKYREMVRNGNKLKIIYGKEYKDDSNFKYNSNIILFKPKKRELFKPVYPGNMNINIWNAPFFYSDSNHVFLVRTIENKIGVEDFEKSYGTPAMPYFELEVIPSKWLTDLIVPPLSEPDVFGPEFFKDTFYGVENEELFQAYLLEAKYISHALNTLGAISFGNIKVGLQGGQVF